MKALPFFVSLLLCAHGAAAAVEPVTVLGLPLGGVVKPPVKACKDLQSSKYLEQSICWVYSNASFNGGRSGALHLPGADSRPAWAAYAEFEAEFKKNGMLTQLTVISRDSNQGGEIIDSISSRFGKPTSSSLSPPFRWYASWNRPEIGISVLCDLGRKCFTRFKSAELAGKEQALIKARVKVDAVRPVSP
jgi:hypothetical protein